MMVSSTVMIAVNDDVYLGKIKALLNIILLVDLSKKDVYTEFFSLDNVVCVTKPLTKQTLLLVIDLINKYHEKIKALEQKVQDLEVRKELERAKGLLMKNYAISENDAYARIQKQSMSKGVTVKKIARAIILAYGGKKKA